MKKIFAVLWAALVLAFAPTGQASESERNVSPDDSSGFVELAEAVAALSIISALKATPTGAAIPIHGSTLEELRAALPRNSFRTV